MFKSNIYTILTGELNAKHLAWISSTTNAAGQNLFNHMDQNDYFVTAHTTPTHFPDKHNRRPDILDIGHSFTANRKHVIQH